MSGSTAEPDPAQRTRAMLVLAEPDLGASAFRLDAAQRALDAGWAGTGGWSYRLDRRTVSYSDRRRGRSVYWQQGLLPEPAAVSGWIARSLAGDLSLPARQGWHLEPDELMTALRTHDSPTLADPEVPTRTSPVPLGSLDRILQRGFDRTLPPPPRVGDDVYVPSRFWRDLAPGAELHGGLTQIVEVRERPGELDWYEVTIAVGEWEENFDWDWLAGKQAEFRQQYGDARATLEGW